MTQTGATAIREALNCAAKCLERAGITNPRMDAQTLLMHVLGRDRAFLFANPEYELSTDQAALWNGFIERRIQSEPIQYITGAVEFYGVPLRVDRSVLIPRPETEHLVEAVLARVEGTQAAEIVDVGTGSGAIAIAIAKQLPLAKITALDLSWAALEVARANAASNGVDDRIVFQFSDLLSGVQARQFNVVVSNPPYIPSADRETLAKQVREYEPAMALFAGPTGFEIYERLISQAATVLKPGGWLLMEIGFGQQDQIRALLSDWRDVTFENDLQSIPRASCARLR